MSRTRRTFPVHDGVWRLVDGWAATATEPTRRQAWVRSRGHLEAASEAYLDVLEAGEEVATAVVGLGGRPVRRPVAARGPLALAPDPEVARRLEDAGIAVRQVTAARRYAWRGPAMAPVLLEVHTTPEQVVVESWWEDVWQAWPRLGREEQRRKAPRVQTAIAVIRRLLSALEEGAPP